MIFEKIGLFIIFIIAFFIPFVFALVIVQILGVDRDKMKYKTGKISMPTRKQLLYAIISTIGVYVVLGGFILFFK